MSAAAIPLMACFSKTQRAERLPASDDIAHITRASGTSGLGSRIAAMILQTRQYEYLVVGVGDAQITFNK